MTIIEQLKAEIENLSPDSYKKAMLMRFGFIDGLTHSRKSVCTKYCIESEMAVKLENDIIKSVFKSDN